MEGDSAPVGTALGTADTAGEGEEAAATALAAAAAAAAFISATDSGERGGSMPPSPPSRLTEGAMADCISEADCAKAGGSDGAAVMGKPAMLSGSEGGGGIAPLLTREGTTLVLRTGGAA